MSAKPLVADDFVAIREALEKLERDKKEAEAPKAWPDYSPVETVWEPSGEIWGHYSAPQNDCAYPPKTLGWNAGLDSLNSSYCPFPGGSAEWLDWIRGHADAVLYKLRCQCLTVSI